MTELTKTAAAVLDYGFDWSAWLNTGDTISTVSWILESGITLDSQANTTTAATCVLSGGEVGTVYTVTCRVTTAAALVDERAMTIRVVASR